MQNVPYGENFTDRKKQREEGRKRRGEEGKKTEKERVREREREREREVNDAYRTFSCSA